MPQKQKWRNKSWKFSNPGVDLLQLGVTAMGGGAVLMGMLNIFESLSSDNPGPRAQGMRQAFGGGVIVLIGTTLVPMLKTMLG